MNSRYEKFRKMQDELLAARRERPNKIWKRMTPFQKHMALMYLYRIKTDLENIKDYVETYRFMEMKITPADLPDFVQRMSPLELRREAYDVIGKLGEVPREPA